jgi:hypothetical protein
VLPARLPATSGFWRRVGCLVERSAKDGFARSVIPVTSIKVAGYVDGQSVMPEGLLDDQVVDLVRYVHSLK